MLRSGDFKLLPPPITKRVGLRRPLEPAAEDVPWCPLKLNTVTGIELDGVLEDTAMGPFGLMTKVVAGAPPPPTPAPRFGGEVTAIKPSLYWT